jgi:RNA polymerase sigma-70 factor, ECF subfamily
MESIVTSLSLLNHARAGKQQAWSDLVRLYGPLVARWCRQYEMQSSDSEDVLQEVFIAVSRHLHAYGQNSEVNSFRGWLWTIARSKIMDYLRRRKGMAVSVDANLLNEMISWEVANDRSSSDARQDLHVLVAQALQMVRSDFSERTWEAFWRTVGLGESTSQVGKDLGMKSAAVCMCRARVLRRLRETLDEFH